jgi:hypothetical protein
MPMEEVMQHEEKRSVLEIRVRGRLIQIEPVSATEGRIIRIISTDPRDFLDPGTQPGRTINIWGSP